MTKRRIVVTGLGLVSPIGADVNSSWANLMASKSGVSKITQFDTDELPCKIAAFVSGEFDAGKYCSPKDQRRNGEFIVYGMAAAIQAIEDAEWKPTEQNDLERTGVLLGSGIGGLPVIEKNSKVSPKQVGPFFIPSSLINLLPGNVAMRYGFQGPNVSAVSACATGNHAIGEAARIIQTGDADVMITGGAEAAICPIGVAGFASAKALSTKFNDNPAQASRPWDQDRDGFIMGDGAGVIVLEEYEHAKKRNAKIYAELAGYGATGDAWHIVAPHPKGLGAKRAMNIALEKAGCNPEDVDYINAHGTSTPVGDGIELEAVQEIFQNCIDKVCMSSTKSSIGHLLGAAGAVEAIFSILSIKHGIIPPTINLENPMPEVRIDLVPNVAKEKSVRVALNNSFGFGGTNASLLFKSV